MIGMNMKAGKTGEPCRLVMLGSGGVGKSALVVRYLTKRFIWEYDPTLEYSYKHQTLIDEDQVGVEILDTAGQAQTINSHSEGHVRWGEGFMIVYSITDRHSFEQVPLLKRYLDEIRKPRNVSCVIVGNKIDLEHERAVTIEEGESLAAELACAFFETSACDGGGDIEESFHELYREVKRRKALEGKTRRRSSAAQVKHVINKMFISNKKQIG